MKTLPCPGPLHFHHQAPLRSRCGRLLPLALMWAGGCLSAPAPIPAGGDGTDPYQLSTEGAKITPDYQNPFFFQD